MRSWILAVVFILSACGAENLAELSSGEEPEWGSTEQAMRRDCGVFKRKRDCRKAGCFWDSHQDVCQPPGGYGEDGGIDGDGKETSPGSTDLNQGTK